MSPPTADRRVFQTLDEYQQGEVRAVFDTVSAALVAAETAHLEHSANVRWERHGILQTLRPVRRD